MYHSVTFGEKNTWTDWGLIPSSRPVFVPPTAKEKFIDIPGKSGPMDLSTLYAGRTVFANRQGSLEFIVTDQTRDWEELYSEITEYLHGRKLRASLEDDPDYFYEGRFSVNAWKSQKDFSRIVIDYNVGPYKKFFSGTLDDWLWDPFDFEEGMIMDYLDLEVNGPDSLTVEIIGGPQEVVPKITASRPMTVKYKGKIYELEAKLNRIPDMILDEGLNQLIFSGNGHVTIDYRGGSL